MESRMDHGCQNTTIIAYCTMWVCVCLWVWVCLCLCVVLAWWSCLLTAIQQTLIAHAVSKHALTETAPQSDNFAVSLSVCLSVCMTVCLPACLPSCPHSLLGSVKEKYSCECVLWSIRDAWISPLYPQTAGIHPFSPFLWPRFQSLVCHLLSNCSFTISVNPKMKDVRCGRKYCYYSYCVGFKVPCRIHLTNIF